MRNRTVFIKMFPASRIKSKSLTVLLGLAVFSLVFPLPTLADGQYIEVQAPTNVANVPLGGIVKPLKEVILTAQMPGRVNYVAGLEGDKFTTDTLLASLDDAELRAKYQSAYAQWSNAWTELQNSGVMQTREYYSPQSSATMGGMGVPGLFDRVFTRPMEGFLGQRDRSVERASDLIIAQNRVSQANMQMESARAEIQALTSKIRDARSVAPFDGVIIQKHVEPGDTVQPGQPLLEFANLELLQVEIDAPVRLVDGLNQDMTLQAQLDNSLQTLPVKVAQIYPMADSRQHTVKVKFDLPPGATMPGRYIRILFPDLQAATQALPVVPSSAIRYKGSLPGVYVRNAEGRPEFRLVRIGEELENGLTSIVAGIRPQEQVMANPGPGISAGWTPRTNLAE